MDFASSRDCLNELPAVLRQVDPDRTVISYDHESDTLLIHFFGHGIPGVSVPVTEDWMVRLDRETNQVIGFHIEHFLSRVVRTTPRLMEVLDVAELRGISAEKIGRLRRDVAGEHRQEAIREVVEEFPTAASAAD